MRHQIGLALLVLFVATLAVSSMTLAVQVVNLKEQVPALAGRLAAAEAVTPSPSPTRTPLPVPTNNPVITELKPNAGKTGTSVTIKGMDFLPTGNDIILGKTFVAKAVSRDGKTLRFNVPPRLVDCRGDGIHEICTIKLTSAFAGSLLPVWIVNSIGASNRVPFLIKR